MTGEIDEVVDICLKVIDSILGSELFQRLLHKLCMIEVREQGSETILRLTQGCRI